MLKQLKSLKIIFILLLIFSGKIVALEDVRLTIGDWPPFMIEDAVDYGPIPSLVKSAFKTQNIAVTFGWFPWKRSYESARVGLWDGTLGWTSTPERRDLFLFSEPVIKLDTVVFHL